MGFPTSPPLCAEHNKTKQPKIDGRAQILPGYQQLIVYYDLSCYSTQPPSLSATESCKSLIYRTFSFILLSSPPPRSSPPFVGSVEN